MLLAWVSTLIVVVLLEVWRPNMDFAGDSRPQSFVDGR